MDHRRQRQCQQQQNIFRMMEEVTHAPVINAPITILESNRSILNWPCIIQTRVEDQQLPKPHTLTVPKVQLDLLLDLCGTAAHVHRSVILSACARVVG